MSSTVIFVVFVSFGGVLFLACLAAALFSFMKKEKKKETHEKKVVHVDEHLKVKEAIVAGQPVVLEMEDDLHFDEIKSNDDNVGAKRINNNALGGTEVVEEAPSASSNHQNSLV